MDDPSAPVLLIPDSSAATDASAGGTLRGCAARADAEDAYVEDCKTYIEMFENADNGNFQVNPIDGSKKWTGCCLCAQWDPEKGHNDGKKHRLMVSAATLSLLVSVLDYYQY